MTITEAHTNPTTTRKLHVAFELASKSWKVAMSDAPGRKPSVVSLEPFDGAALVKAITRAKERFGLSPSVGVAVCMEAGRDGFSVHRWLAFLGMDSLVIDPASIEVSRHNRRAKTDRLDVLKLLANLMRHDSGETHVWRVCHVPSEEAEDRRHLHREREVLVQERTEHLNRIKGMLATQGIQMKVRSTFLDELGQVRDARGRSLPRRLLTRLQHEHARLALLAKQIAELDEEMHKVVTTEPTRDAHASARKTWTMAQLRGLGPVTSHILVGELFGWRDFKNRRQVGGAAGLTPTPYDTGNTDREQGISKAGNSRARHIAVEAAWSWLRFQPDSALSIWFRAKFPRQPKIGIVALARKLPIALWHFVEHGTLPAGAKLKPASSMAA